MTNSILYKEFLAEREEILRHKWIESEKAGHDIGFEKALLDWIVRFRSSWRDKRRSETSARRGLSDAVWHRLSGTLRRLPAARRCAEWSAATAPSQLNWRPIAASVADRLPPLPRRAAERCTHGCAGHRAALRRMAGEIIERNGGAAIDGSRWWASTRAAWRSPGGWRR